jgi:phosphoglycolate phosphatase
LAGQDIKLSILSNKYDDFTKECVSEFLPEWKFEQVRGRVEGVPLKPDPTAALQIAESVGINPSDTIFIGDSGVDMQTAVAAGMVPIGVLWGFRGKKELEDGGAKMLLKRPQDLLTFICMDNT